MKKILILNKFIKNTHYDSTNLGIDFALLKMRPSGAQIKRIL